MYTRLRAALGGRCTAAVSGGAPLGERLAHFFRGVGVPVLEGYGLTETSAAACVNTQDALRVGTVGRPVAGTSVRIADDGEILISGAVVFRQYWNNEAATKEALDGGWFHTGDLGSLDDDGFLRITGRKKEIIVTAGGKNVSPAVLEDRLRAHPLISQCMVVGDKQPFIGALVTIDEEFFPAWKAQHSKPARPAVADLADGPGPGRRDPGGGRRGQQGGVQGRVDPQVPDPAGGLHRGGRRDDAEPQAAQDVVAKTYEGDIAAIYA